MASVSAEDAWALQSLSRGEGRVLPRLRWAKREHDFGFRPAHLAISFDSFSSSIEIEESESGSAALISYGLTANLQRQFEVVDGRPCWRLWVPVEQDGLKLTNRVVTDRLSKMQGTLAYCVCRANSGSKGQPVIKTVPTSDDVENLESLHRSCDWVVTVDRNAGVEYFDSPRAVPAVYDAYLIDAVPERDDLGCLQMITSTAHFDEVRHLLDHTLALMGLSGSSRNCEFLLGHLKGLSGRLAMRLASGGADMPTTRIGAELIALCLVRANCLVAGGMSDCWLPLESGFFVPIDDVRDLVPEASLVEDGDEVDEDPNTVANGDSRRADLLFVSAGQKGRLHFRFVEVKYRRHLASARSSSLVETVVGQTARTRERWMDWFFGTSLSNSERAIRAGRLARTLRFYADKAVRHYLSPKVADRVREELEKLVKDPSAYEPGQGERSDRAFVFCPDYSPMVPEELFPGLDEECRVWLFGSDTLPDRPFMSDQPPVEASTNVIPSMGNSEIEQEQSNGNLPEIHYTNVSGVPTMANPALSTEIGESSENVETSLIPVVPLGQSRDNRIVTWSPAIAGNPHLMIVGLPGMGKTTCLINICKKLVAGNVMPIIFSYHDDIDEKLTEVFPRIRLGAPSKLGFNPMRITHEGPLAHIESAGQLRDIFSAIFPDLGELQLEPARRRTRNGHSGSQRSKEGQGLRL